MPYRATCCASTWRTRSLAILALATMVGCEDAQGGPPTADADASLDAGVVLDATIPEPAPDLRFKWVGAQTGAQVRAEVELSRSDGTEQIWKHEGAAGVLPLGFHVTERSMSAGIADAGESRVGITYSALFKPHSPIVPFHIRRVARSRRWLEDELEQRADRGLMMVSAIDLQPDGFTLTIVRHEHVYRVPAYRRTSASVPRSMLTDWLARAGDAGQVITAISGDGEQTFVAAYSRDDDTRRYEAKMLEAGSSDLAERARALSEEGYIITAFGRAGTTLLLIGTRPVGEQVKRESRAMSLAEARRLLESEEGFAVVAWIRPDATFPNDDGGLVIVQR